MMNNFFINPTKTKRKKKKISKSPNDVKRNTKRKLLECESKQTGSN